MNYLNIFVFNNTKERKSLIEGKIEKVICGNLTICNILKNQKLEYKNTITDQGFLVKNNLVYISNKVMKC